MRAARRCDRRRGHFAVERLDSLVLGVEADFVEALAVLVHQSAHPCGLVIWSRRLNGGGLDPGGDGRRQFPVSRRGQRLQAFGVEAKPDSVNPSGILLIQGTHDLVASIVLSGESVEAVLRDVVLDLFDPGHVFVGSGNNSLPQRHLVERLLQHSGVTTGFGDILLVDGRVSRSLEGVRNGGRELTSIRVTRLGSLGRNAVVDVGRAQRIRGSLVESRVESDSAGRLRLCSTGQAGELQ